MKERWINFVHKILEWFRNDPDTTYNDWKKITQAYREGTGKDYVRKS